MDWRAVRTTSTATRYRALVREPKTVLRYDGAIKPSTPFGAEKNVAPISQSDCATRPRSGCVTRQPTLNETISHARGHFKGEARSAGLEGRNESSHLPPPRNSPAATTGLINKRSTVHYPRPPSIPVRTGSSRTSPTIIRTRRVRHHRPAPRFPEPLLAAFCFDISVTATGSRHVRRGAVAAGNRETRHRCRRTLSTANRSVPYWWSVRPLRRGSSLSSVASLRNSALSHLYLSPFPKSGSGLPFQCWCRGRPGSGKQSLSLKTVRVKNTAPIFPTDRIFCAAEEPIRTRLDHSLVPRWHRIASEQGYIGIFSTCNQSGKHYSGKLSHCNGSRKQCNPSGKQCSGKFYNCIESGKHCSSKFSTCIAPGKHCSS